MAKVIALPAFQHSKTISCYLSMPTAEVQTTALISNILADNGMASPPLSPCEAMGYSQKAGKKLFVPSLASKDRQMDFVRLYDDEDLRTLPAGLWGIPEPTAEWGSRKRQSGM